MSTAPAEVVHAGPVRAAETGAVVAQVMGSFGGGGAQRLALNLAEALAERGVRSLAIALRSSGGFAEASETVALESLNLSGGAADLAGGVRRLRSVIAQHGVSVLHVHGSGGLPLCALAVKGLRPRPALHFTWHDSGTVLGGSRLRRLALRWALRRCDAVYAPSQDIARRIDESSGVAASVFINGVPEIGPREPSADDPVRLLWVGRFVPPKDPKAVVRAVAALRSEGHDVVATLAGGASERQRWLVDETRQLAEDLGVGEWIKLPGWVEDTAALVHAHDVGVQTSHTEGLSMALLEQMMAGLAIVATDVGDTARAVEPGVSGELIAPRDDDALASALRGLVSDRDKLESFGAAARARALAQFTLDAMARRAADLYGLAG